MPSSPRDDDDHFGFVYVYYPIDGKLGLFGSKLTATTVIVYQMFGAALVLCDVNAMQMAKYVYDCMLCLKRTVAFVSDVSGASV